MKITSILLPRPLLYLLGMMLYVSSALMAQDFDRFFTDSTLRLDYIFSGDATKVNIYPEEKHILGGWYGRRHHLDSLPLAGLGQITVTDKDSGSVIYRTSFSSLFQEWLTTEEAQRRQVAYENVYLVPLPRQSAYIDVELYDMQRNVVSAHRQEVDPKDILIHRYPQYRSLPYEYLHRGQEDDRKAINVVILAEGYQEQEMQAFIDHARRATDAIMEHEPFRRNREHFNVIAVRSPSVDSDVSVPSLGQWRYTAFGSHFDTFYSSRYLTTRRVKSIHDALIGIPYEHIIILANTHTYGGGGIYNSYTLGSVHHEQFEPVIVHEFGHSFGGLADEYFYEDDPMSGSYPLDIEPWEQNVTNLTNFYGHKWSHLLPKSLAVPTPIAKGSTIKVGLYEGAAYSSRGLYRASYNCRMRTNEYHSFCPACDLALERLIHFYVRD